MADNKTEQATPRRRQKARDKGQVARSRELPSALAGWAVLLVLAWQSRSLAAQWRELFRNVLGHAISDEIQSTPSIASWIFMPALRWSVPPLIACFGLALASSVAQGGLVFAPSQLAPSVERINPASRLKQVLSISSVSALLKSLIPFSAIAYLACRIIVRDWDQILRAPFLSPAACGEFLLGHVYEIAWKALLVLLLWSGLDYLLVRVKFERELKMSHQEVREEMKENEGNPQIKARIRRLQRQVRRQRMLQDVQRATVVIANPTHFAIALEYRQEMAAPMVIAKGRNVLALQIKQAAMWHSIPVVENPPLAHALYRAVEVGQSIPAKLYVAVAEILAFVYRTQQRTARGGWQ